MKSAATVFLAAFLALSASWAGFVLAPQLQLGRAPQVKPTGSDGVYPVARAGLAQQGAQVYRSLGCVHCHSQSVGQEKTICELVLIDAGTNAPATLAALASFDKELAKPATLAGLPKVIKTVTDVPAAVPMIKALKAAGATAEAKVSAQGPDIARAWGLRRSVAQDYAYDETVQIGTRRNGPDLANVGLTKSSLDWHLLHLYAPTAVVTGSTMPPYRFLFAKRKITRAPSTDALQLSGELAPPAGYEIAPTEAARALAAYLVSLRVDAPLYEAPFTPFGPPCASDQCSREMNADPKNLNATTEAEPVSEPTAVPMWLIMALLVLLFLGAWFFDARGGWLFDAKVYGPYQHAPEAFQPPPPDGADRRRGQMLFEKHCAICHNNDGAGKPGQAPPLAGSEWVNTKGVNRIIRIPLVGLTGPITVKNQNYDGLSMVGLGGGLTDEDVVNILSYIRNAWGNKAPDLTVEQVKKVRTELGNRSLQYTPAELLKLEE